jgi:hypothetical protein
MDRYCSGCTFIGPAIIPYDNQYRRYFCTKHQSVETDYVTGQEFVHLVLCSTVNKDGNCPDYAPGESARLQWRPEGGDGK